MPLGRTPGHIRKSLPTVSSLLSCQERSILIAWCSLAGVPVLENEPEETAGALRANLIRRCVYQLVVEQGSVDNIKKEDVIAARLMGEDDFFAMVEMSSKNGSILPASDIDALMTSFGFEGATDTTNPFIGFGQPSFANDLGLSLARASSNILAGDPYLQVPSTEYVTKRTSRIGPPNHSNVQLGNIGDHRQGTVNNQRPQPPAIHINDRVSDSNESQFHDSQLGDSDDQAITPPTYTTIMACNEIHQLERWRHWARIPPQFDPSFCTVASYRADLIQRLVYIVAIMYRSVGISGKQLKKAILVDGETFVHMVRSCRAQGFSISLQQVRNLIPIGVKGLKGWNSRKNVR